MNENKLAKIDNLINNNKVNEAQNELSKLGPNFFKNSEYLYLRSKIFYINKLYYIAIDTLLIALEFEEKEKIYNMISKIYNTIGNQELGKKIADKNLRVGAIEKLKNELTGIIQKKQ
tara:strand:+ start:683 stop:1033 length:351 start_codon:yes stop_codon:yes gene_type:complete